MTMKANPIYTRRSIRKFSDKNVPIELINEILDAGRMAPSAKNRQPWRYIIFGNEKKAELLYHMEQGLIREEQGIPLLPESGFGIPDAKNTLRAMQEAPIIILVINTNGHSPFFPIYSDGRITEMCDLLSIGASIENMLLTAESLGLGTLWIANTCFAYTEIMGYLKINGQLVGAVAVGYANERPVRRPRKEAEEIVTYRL